MTFTHFFQRKGSELKFVSYPWMWSQQGIHSCSGIQSKTACNFWRKHWQHCFTLGPVFLDCSHKTVRVLNSTSSIRSNRSTRARLLDSLEWLSPCTDWTSMGNYLPFLWGRRDTSSLTSTSVLTTKTSSLDKACTLMSRSSRWILRWWCHYIMC